MSNSSPVYFFRLNLSNLLGVKNTLICISTVIEMHGRMLEFVLIIRSLISNTRSFIEKHGFKIILPPESFEVLDYNISKYGRLAAISWERVTAAVLELGLTSESVLFADHYSFRKQWFNTISKISPKIIASDNFCNRELHCSSLGSYTPLFQQNVYRTLLTRPCKILVSLQYAFLRYGIQLAKSPWLKNFLQNIVNLRPKKDIIVFLGGRNTDIYTGKIEETLSNIGFKKYLKITILLTSQQKSLITIVNYLNNINTYIDKLVASASFCRGVGKESAIERLCISARGNNEINSVSVNKRCQPWWPGAPFKI